MNALQEFGIALIQALQILSPTLDVPMNIFTFLGKIEFYMLFITLIYWIIDAQLGFRVLMILLSTDIFGIGFKLLFNQPRPYWIGGVKGMGVETGYGIPSTHASDSLSVWSYLAYRVKKRWLWITAIMLILLISFSRLYLGVHFPHDVVFGWVIGLVVLFLFIKNEQKVAGWFNARETNSQLWVAFILSLVFAAVGILVKALIAGTTDAAAWSHFSTEARSLSPFFTLAGAFIGATTGYIMMKQYAPFQTAGSGLQKGIRYFVGILGVLVIMYGLDLLFSLIAADETVLGYILRYIRYGAVTFWAMFGAPWVFLKLNLTASKSHT